MLYRDLKPENVGFDIRGDVKLFDFGLMKGLERRDKVEKGYGYKLSAKTGSIPYMAPEIALGTLLTRSNQANTHSETRANTETLV